MLRSSSRRGDGCRLAPRRGWPLLDVLAMVPSGNAALQHGMRYVAGLLRLCDDLAMQRNGVDLQCRTAIVSSCFCLLTITRCNPVSIAPASA